MTFGSVQTARPRRSILTERRLRVMPYKDKDKKLLNSVAYRATHRVEKRAYNAAYVAEHRVEKRAYNTAYRAAHRDENRARCAAYYAAHREEQRAIHSSWSAAHPVECAAFSAKKRALKRSATIGDPKAIAAVYRRARENKTIRCYLCGKLIPLGERHVDHIIPLCKGGPHTASNLGITCAKCNMKKGAKLPEEVGLLL